MVRILNDGLNERLERRALTRRLEILRAAGRTFRRLGFVDAGMREIAMEADLSPGNLYYYFTGKDEILFFCQDRSLDAMLESLAAATRCAESSAEKLHRVVIAHLRVLLDELEGSTAHLEINSLPAELREKLVEKRDRYERGIRRLISTGVRGGEFAPCDPKLVTRAILGALNWTALWYRSDGTRSVTSVAGSFASYLVRGLVAETPMDRSKTRRGGSE
ncbi:MAG: TetR/AcrR family transcriptional regulator [Candidatus Krumholzibacteria bacterium]